MSVDLAPARPSRDLIEALEIVAAQFGKIDEESKSIMTQACNRKFEASHLVAEVAQKGHEYDNIGI